MFVQNLFRNYDVIKWLEEKKIENQQFTFEHLLRYQHKELERTLMYILELKPFFIQDSLKVKLKSNHVIVNERLYLVYSCFDKGGPTNLKRAP